MEVAAADRVSSSQILPPQPFVFDLPADVEKKADAVHFPQYQLPATVLVTGGCGFLGRNIISALLQQKDVQKVVAFDIVKGKFEDPRVVMAQGDLRSEALQAALQQHAVGAIIHTASPHPNGTNKKIFYDVNVDGTKSALQAAAASGVRAFVYTSSASVVWQGSDHAGVDESVPYPTSYRDYYAQTKALAEQAVMHFGVTHGAQVITISVRPHAIFGPGDRQLVPTLIDRAKEGKDKWIIGNGENVVDFTYIGNVVHSHLLAVQAAHVYWASKGTGVGCPANGKTFFITNGEPMRFWDVLNSFVQGLGYRGGRMRLPAWFLKGVAYPQQWVVDVLQAVTGKPIQLTLSPARVEIISTVHWYSISAATRDLAYKPLWDMATGIYLTLKAFPELRQVDPSPEVVARAKGTNLIKLGLIVDNTRAAEKRVPAAQRDPSTLPAYTPSEVACHCSEKDMWVIVKGLVYDLTPFVPLHPGGVPMIMQHPGQDVSKGFHGPQHPESVHTVLAQHLIGRVAA